MGGDDERVARVWREVRGAQLDLLHGLVADVASLVPGAIDRATWGRVRDSAQRLSGTLGSIQLRPAGDVARALEELTGQVDVPDAGVVASVRDLTAALHAAVPHGPAECPAS